MFIGFNIDKANIAMEGVSGAYTDVINKISTGWEELQGLFRREWVGPDEQDFEQRLKERLESLERAMKLLADDTVDIFDELARSWANFQDSNTISGNATGYATELLRHLKKPNITRPISLIFDKLAFDSTTNFGLTNSNATSSIRSGLENFVSMVKNNAESLFSQIDTNAAFYGENQAAKLKSLKDKVGEAIAIIATSIKDLDIAMETLTSGYKTADTTIGDAVGSAAENVASSVDEATKETRWTSGGGSFSTSHIAGNTNSQFSQASRAD